MNMYVVVVVGHGYYYIDRCIIYIVVKTMYIYFLNVGISMDPEARESSE